MIISSVALWVFSLLSTYSPFEKTVRLVWSLLTVAKPREQYKVNSIVAFEMQNVIKIVLYINLETSQKDCFKFVKSLSVVIKNVDHYLSIEGRGVLGCFWPFFSEREGSSSLDLTLDVTLMPARKLHKYNFLDCLLDCIVDFSWKYLLMFIVYLFYCLQVTLPEGK